jgi:hypothetical protein
MRQTVSRDVQDIVFLGEQDGPAEQQLKERLATLFEQQADVMAAYLVRAVVDGETSVILGLRAAGADESELARKVGAVFASIFNARAHLDVVFLSADRHAAVSRVSRAFYTQDVQ